MTSAFYALLGGVLALCALGHDRILDLSRPSIHAKASMSAAPQRLAFRLQDGIRHFAPDEMHREHVA